MKHDLTVLLLVVFWVCFPTVATGQGVQIHSYAAQPRFHDTVNTHWIETENGLIVIDTQRLISEAERAIKHIRSFGKPVKAIFITHAHSDHYGGLPIFKDAFPNAKIYANQTTIDSIQQDNRGYTAARKKRLGDDFVSQDALNRALPDHRVKDGDLLEVAGVSIRIDGVKAGEAEDGIVVYLPDHAVLFAADTVNNGYVPAPLESLDQWLLTLEEWKHRYPLTTLAYVGHGPEAPLPGLIDHQMGYLSLLRDEVLGALDDKILSAQENDEIAFKLERAYPHLHGVGGNSRLNVIKFVVGHVAKQYGGTVQTQTEFR